MHWHTNIRDAEGRARASVRTADGFTSMQCEMAALEMDYRDNEIEVLLTEEVGELYIKHLKVLQQKSKNSSSSFRYKPSERKYDAGETVFLASDIAKVVQYFVDNLRIDLIYRRHIIAFQEVGDSFILLIPNAALNATYKRAAPVRGVMINPPPVIYSIVSELPGDFLKTIFTEANLIREKRAKLNPSSFEGSDGKYIEEGVGLIKQKQVTSAAKAAQFLFEKYGQEIAGFGTQESKEKRLARQITKRLRNLGDGSD